jgi:hypothetical protein
MSKYETPGILKIIDTKILPLIKAYNTADDEDKREIAKELLVFGGILEYHYPEYYKECIRITR